VRSRVEDYRAKAKEYARLTVVTKLLREGRRYRKLAEMYWTLALGMGGRRGNAPGDYVFRSQFTRAGAGN
jgi:hypothetical protein